MYTRSVIVRHLGDTVWARYSGCTPEHSHLNQYWWGRGAYCCDYSTAPANQGVPWHGGARGRRWGPAAGYLKSRASTWAPSLFLFACVSSTHPGEVCQLTIQLVYLCSLFSLQILPWSVIDLSQPGRPFSLLLW